MSTVQFMEVDYFLDKELMWGKVKEMALNTVGKKYAGGEITPKWKAQILACQHSPIRALQFVVTMDIPYFVSVHLVRHKHGVEHFVTTQRTDRTGIDRTELPQGAIVRHKMIINAEALINISRKRLCMLASPETRDAWQQILWLIKDLGEEELYELCVVDCVYRGLCAETFGCCGYSATESYIGERERYFGYINSITRK